MDRPVEIFFSYAHEDAAFKEEIRRQLVGFDRRGVIRKWHDRMISPGSEWEPQINHHLTTSDVLLLFISAHFLDSDFCYEREMTEAMRRHDAGEARVIPIIVSSCLWESEPFARLQVLPTDGRPLDTWPNRSEGALNVARGIMHIVSEVNSQPSAVRSPDL